MYSKLVIVFINRAEILYFSSFNLLAVSSFNDYASNSCTFKCCNLQVQCYKVTLASGQNRYYRRHLIMSTCLFLKCSRQPFFFCFPLVNSSWMFAALGRATESVRPLLLTKNHQPPRCSISHAGPPLRASSGQGV